MSNTHIKYSIICLAIAIPALTAWSYSRLHSSMDKAKTFRRDFIAMTLVADDLNRIRPSQKIEYADKTISDLATTVQKAATRFNIWDNVEDSNPINPRLVSRADNIYEAGHEVRMRALTLQELTNFLYEVESSDKALYISDLELTAPAEARPGKTENWNVTARITYRYKNSSAFH